MIPIKIGSIITATDTNKSHLQIAIIKEYFASSTDWKKAPRTILTPVTTNATAYIFIEFTAILSTLSVGLTKILTISSGNTIHIIYDKIPNIIAVTIAIFLYYSTLSFSPAPMFTLISG